MPNPRFISRTGEPSTELLMKLEDAKRVFLGQLESFCEKHHYDINTFRRVKGIYLVGSHAEDSNWKEETSDIDFVFICPDALPENLLRYKREVLDPKLHISDEKRRWVDVFFEREEYQVNSPRVDITPYWERV